MALRRRLLSRMYWGRHPAGRPSEPGHVRVGRRLCAQQGSDRESCRHDPPLLVPGWPGVSWVFSEKPIGSGVGGRYDPFRDWSSLPDPSGHLLTPAQWRAVYPFVRSPAPSLDGGASRLWLGLGYTFFSGSAPPNSIIPDCGPPSVAGGGAFSRRGATTPAGSTRPWPTARSAGWHPRSTPLSGSASPPAREETGGTPDRGAREPARHRKLEPFDREVYLPGWIPGGRGSERQSLLGIGRRLMSRRRLSLVAYRFIASASVMIGTGLLSLLSWPAALGQP